MESHLPPSPTKKVLIIGYVWPEPESSAAGLRSWNLIHALQADRWEIVFASHSQTNTFSDRLQSHQIRIQSIQPNDSSFDAWIQLEAFDLVIFDRFVIEEQFGWRFQEHSPQTLRLLDTQDVHFLRRTRERLLKEGQSLSKIKHCTQELFQEDTFREVAAYYRCDGVFVLSDFEQQLISSLFHYPQNQIHLGRFHYRTPEAPLPFEERSHFVMIGNFRHAPNRDAILWLKNSIWPLIRKSLPQAEVHIYGAYPPKDLMQLHSKDSGFFVHGSTPNQFETLKKYRVNLAPIRFGAGIKGKISDGWWCGTPTVSTSLGIEGMHEHFSLGGLSADQPEEFAQHAITLHEDARIWKQAQADGLKILSSLYDEKKNTESLIHFIQEQRTHFQMNRHLNWIGSLLSYHQYRSTKYFSRWIEEKSKRLGNDVSSK